MATAAACFPPNSPGPPCGSPLLPLCHEAVGPSFLAPSPPHTHTQVRTAPEAPASVRGARHRTGSAAEQQDEHTPVRGLPTGPGSLPGIQEVKEDSAGAPGSGTPPHPPPLPSPA